MSEQCHGGHHANERFASIRECRQDQHRVRVQMEHVEPERLQDRHEEIRKRREQSHDGEVVEGHHFTILLGACVRADLQLVAPNEFLDKHAVGASNPLLARKRARREQGLLSSW